MSQTIEWIAVDWGTSNVRAWGIDAAGEAVFARNSPDGMSRLSREQYPSVLSGLLPDAAADLDVIICGMAGARQGWMEAPYLDAPADLVQLATGGARPEMPGHRFSVRILPGVCQRDAGAEDVMRGEETQLLGLARLQPGYSGLVVMPGTHSKWAMLDGSQLVRFSSAMTGELFEVLRQHSVLRHSLGGELDGEDREIGFGVGVEQGLSQPGRLTATLFKVRAGALLSDRSPAWCAGFLSGLLIGTEIGGQRDWIGTGIVPLVGSVALCGLYQQAFSRLGVDTAIVDATDATLAGLKAACEEQA